MSRDIEPSGNQALKIALPSPGWRGERTGWSLTGARGGARRGSDLLDRRQQPIAAAMAHERPQLLRRHRPARVALHDIVAVAGSPVAADVVVLGVPAHQRLGIVDVVLVPGLLQRAVLELHVLDAILDAVARIARQLLGE